MIRERPHSWAVRVYAGIDPATGKQRHLYGSAPNKREARKLEAEFEKQVARARVGPSSRTVDQLLDQWLDVARHAPSTKYDTERRVARHVRPVLGKERVQAVTTERLDTFYRELEREGLAPATIRRLHGMVRAAFGQAVRWDWIERNPAVGVRLPEVPNPTPAATAPATIQTVIRSAPPDFAAFLRLMAVTGMRRGEACALRRSDLDLDAGIVRKTRAISMNEERQTKTGARYALAIDAATVEELRTHLTAMDDRAADLDMKVADNAFLFSHEPDCSKAWRPDNQTLRLRRLCDKLGVEGVTLKGLRDFAATQLLESGHSVRTVAGRLGHARGSTTLTHYAAFVPASDRDAAETIGDLLDRS